MLVDDDIKLFNDLGSVINVPTGLFKPDVNDFLSCPIFVLQGLTANILSSDEDT